MMDRVLEKSIHCISQACARALERAASITASDRPIVACAFCLNKTTQIETMRQAKLMPDPMQRPRRSLRLVPNLSAAGRHSSFDDRLTASRSLNSL
jgi:hypothetical protein